jgi:hypothetical protein
MKHSLIYPLVILSIACIDIRCGIFVGISFLIIEYIKNMYNKNEGYKHILSAPNPYQTGLPCKRPSTRLLNITKAPCNDGPFISYHSTGLPGIQFLGNEPKLGSSILNPGDEEKKLTSNQALTVNKGRTQHPATLIAPVIPARLTDIDHWRQNATISHSGVNKERTQYLYESGYISEPCSESDRPGCLLGSTQDLAPYPSNPNLGQPKTISREYPTYSQHSGMHQEHSDTHSHELTYPNPDQLWDDSSCGNYSTMEGDMVDMECGVGGGCGIANFDSDLPEEYTRNLFTQSVDPEVFVYDKVVEPTNGNLGISFAQSLLPVSVEQESYGDTYTIHDPNNFDPYVTPKPFPTADESNVYDPRFNGYGTNYRAYNDTQLGQPKYYYDDINAIRQPNYLVRSKIDNEIYADTYGPMKSLDGNTDTSVIRELAERSWVDNSLSFRNSLQLSRMAPANNRAWQRRMAPINTYTSNFQGGL